MTQVSLVPFSPSTAELELASEMTSSTFLQLSSLLWFVLANAACPPGPNGTFYVDVPDVYPESADWSPISCKLYLRVTYNLSLVAFDPYSNTSEVIPIPGITNYGNFRYSEYHLNGADFDTYTGEMLIAAGSANALLAGFKKDYAHANYTGPNRILKFDTTTNTFTEDIDLFPAQDVYYKKMGNRTSGFQDVAETRDAAFALGSFGNSIVKIPKSTNKPEICGIVAIGDLLVLNDLLSGGLVTFDSRPSDPQPTYVPLQGLPRDYRPLSSDGLYAPSKYGRRVISWSDDYNGTSVYGSIDNWATAHFLGLVLNDEQFQAEGGFITATCEIGDRIFMLNEFFQDLPQKYRASFPMYGVTEQIDAFVANNPFGKGFPDWDVSSYIE